MAKGIDLGGMHAGDINDTLVSLLAQKMAERDFAESQRRALMNEQLARDTLAQRKSEATAEDTRAGKRLKFDQTVHGDNLGLNIKRDAEKTRVNDRDYARGVVEFDTTHEFKKGESERDQGNKDRSFGLDELTVKETGRHNRAMEGIASDRTGAAAGAKTKAADERAKSARASIEKALQTIRRLRGDDDKGNRGTGAAGFAGAVGAKGPASAFGLLERPMGGTDAADFAAAFDTLKAQLTVPELEKMRGTGALSDRDVAMLSAGASSLNRAQSEAAFLSELNRLDDTFSAALGAGSSGGSAPGIGDVVNIGGKRVRISKLYPDGSFDGEDVP